MKHTTLTRKSIVAATCFCFAASLTAETPEKSEQGPATVMQADSAQGQTLPKSSLVKPASIPAMTPAQWVQATPVQDLMSNDKSWVRVEPGVLSLATRMDPTVMPPTLRYGAAPAVVNFNFGRK